MKPTDSKRFDIRLLNPSTFVEFMADDFSAWFLPSVERADGVYMVLVSTENSVACAPNQLIQRVNIALVVDELCHHTEGTWTFTETPKRCTHLEVVAFMREAESRVLRKVAASN